MIPFWKLDRITEILAEKKILPGSPVAAAGPPKKKEKIIFWNFTQTPSYDTFLETRDLYEYFAEKIIEKYSFLTKLGRFSYLLTLTSAFFTDVRTPAGNDVNVSILF